MRFKPSEISKKREPCSLIKDLPAGLKVGEHRTEMIHDAGLSSRLKICQFKKIQKDKKNYI